MPAELYEIAESCSCDVKLTKRVHEYGAQHRQLVFSVDQSVRLEENDRAGIQRLIQYFLRCPFFQAGMIEVTGAGKVLSKSGDHRLGRFPEAASDDLLAGPKCNFQVFDPLDFLVEVTQDIPETGDHLQALVGQGFPFRTAIARCHELGRHRFRRRLRRALDEGTGVAYAVGAMPEMTDTPPEVAEMVRARLMARSGAERFRMGVEMFEAARRMVLASLPAGLTETERRQHLFQRICGIPLPERAGNRAGNKPVTPSAPASPDQTFSSS